MPLIIRKKECFRIPTDAIAVNDGPFDAVEVEKKEEQYIIHAGGPAASFYHRCLEKALALDLSSIAMPLLKQESTDDVFANVADTIREFLEDSDMNVYLLTDASESPIRQEKLYADIRSYLDHALPVAYYAGSMEADMSMAARTDKPKAKKKRESSIQADVLLGYQKRKESAVSEEEEALTLDASAPYPEEPFIPDESFSECLIRMIDERKMSDPEVYKKANIDRKHFNHIINDKHYRPRKETVVALAIGMKLDMKDTDTLLERAGFVLSRSFKFDLIIRYCIEHQIYNIYDINEILFAEDQPTLGC